jgi:hypothetical protein
MGTAFRTAAARLVCDEQHQPRRGGTPWSNFSGFDRLVIRGTLRMLAHRGGMMSYLSHVGVLLKDLKRDIREVAPRPMRITEEP